jgi:HSP20 family protein
MKNEVWDPFNDMEEFKKKVDKMFEEFWKSATFPKDLKLREPLVDIVEKKNAYEARVELPGVNEKDVVVSIDNNKVEIKAEKRKEKEQKKKDYFRQERTYKAFYKAFTLPQAVNGEKAKMKFKDGMLLLTLPKLKLANRKVLKLK